MIGNPEIYLGYCRLPDLVVSDIKIIEPDDHMPDLVFITNKWNLASRTEIDLRYCQCKRSR